MAFTLGFHIILASLGVAFPAMMLIANYRGLRHDDADALLLARRWSKVVAVTFAVGAVTGTVLSFEFGLLWPEFTGRFGEVFGVLFAIEGIFFFLEAIFVAIYIFGWKRLPAVGALLDRRADRDHRARRRLLGRRRELVDEPAAGLHARPSGNVTDVDPLKVIFNPAVPYEVPHMILAAYLVDRLPGRVGLRGRDAARPARPLPPARAADPADGRLRSRRRSSSRSATPPRARSPRTSRSSSRRWSACRRRRRDVTEYIYGRCTAGRRQGRDRDPGLRLVPGRLEHRHAGHRARHRAARRPPAREHDAALGVRHDGRHLHRADRARAVARVRLVAQARHPEDALVPARRRGLGRGRDRGARVRLDRDRGRPPAVDRLRGDAHRGRGHRRRAASGSPSRSRSRSTRCSASATRDHPARDGAALARGGRGRRRRALRPPASARPGACRRARDEHRRRRRRRAVGRRDASYAVFGGADFGAGFWAWSPAAASAAGARAS